MHRAYTLAEMKPGPLHARGLTLMARNDEPDPCRAADAYEQAHGDYTERLERARAHARADFAAACDVGDLDAPCPWAPMVSRRNPLGHQIKRHPTFAELLRDELETDAFSARLLRVLLDTASGIPAQERAAALLRDAGAKWADYTVEV